MSTSLPSSVENGKKPPLFNLTNNHGCNHNNDTKRDTTTNAMTRMNPSAVENNQFEQQRWNMRVTAYEEMNSSKRNTMEDCHVIHEPGSWLAPDPELAYLAVYDGHGGRDMVNYLEHGLSYHVATELAVKDEADMETRLERAFLMADVHSLHSGVTTSGATVVLCLVKKLVQTNQIKIYTANVGDARAVVGLKRKRNDIMETSSTMDTTTTTVVRLSKDHRTDDPQEVQRIEKSGGFLFKGRVLGVLAVTRSLGDQCMKEYVIAKPYFKEYTIDLPPPSTVDDQRQVLIVACDGLWDVVNDEEAIDLVFDYCQQQQYNENDKSVAQFLSQEAVRRGSTDNITVIVAWL